MTKEEKRNITDELVKKLQSTQYFYVTDASGLTVESINRFRRLCDKEGISYKVYKNTLIQKALERLEGDYESFSRAVLVNFSGIIFSPESGNLPAKVITQFRKAQGVEKPLLKGAVIEGETYLGNDQIETLSTLKSRKELIADVVLLLESPIKNIISAIDPGGTLLPLLDAIAQKKDEQAQ